jgi:LDH2 family malate/lactate/ureidoglycolate dehydrogenase
MLMPLAILVDWATRILVAGGMPLDAAALAAGLMVRTDARGYSTHGLTRLPSYVERLASGDFNPRPTMRHWAFPGGIVLDADGAMGHVAAPRAIELAIDALQQSASVLVAIRSCGHLGALGIHALQAAEAGMLCLIGQTTPPLLAMEGFRGAAIGHNPLAFASPVPGQPPIVFDMACSVAARGHILEAAREARDIPAGWAVDRNGQPTTDANDALAGALLPAGGHKGIGLAMMVQCLAGGLAAQAGVAAAPAETPLAGAAGGLSAFAWLVKPAAFAEPDAFAAHMAQWSGVYLAQGADAARLPGARGAALEVQCREGGLAIEGTLRRELVKLGEALSIPFPSVEGGAISRESSR